MVMKDVITGLMLIAAMVTVFTITIAWVGIWDSTWQVSIEPTRASMYAARLGPFVFHILGVGGGLRVVA